jgi:poly(A) polymerase
LEAVTQTSLAYSLRVGASKSIDMSDPDPQHAFAVEVVRRLKAAGWEALWAGGCVRDLLLGRTPKDYDVATNARPNEVRKVFGHRRTLAVGASFGVIVVRGPSKSAGQVEVATFRTEGPYADGRRPDHVEFTTAEEDAQRRDFTINGMFYDPLAQSVHDYVDGERDLNAGIVRAIGDPTERMREDKLRMLRAVRFSATMDFELDSETANAVRGMAAEIHVVSAERIAQEMKRMLVDPHRARAISLANDLALLMEVFPELCSVIETAGAGNATDLWQITLNLLRNLQEPCFELALAALFHGVGGPPATQASPAEAAKIVHSVCRRLRLSNHETDLATWLTEQRESLDEAQTLSPARLKRLLAHPRIHDLIALNHGVRLARNADLSPILFCEEYLRNTPAEEIDPPPLVSGDDLIAQGLKPGRLFKQLLEDVRDAQLNGEIDTKSQALELAKRLAGGDDGGQSADG